MSNAEERAKIEVEVLQDCIGCINRIEGIAARASAADWLAGVYRRAAIRAADEPSPKGDTKGKADENL